MNTSYLDTLPEAKNKFNVPLEAGEKVVFTAKPWGFAANDGVLLGADDSRITMTNKRIMADNGNGIWTADIAEDVVSMKYEESGKFLSKETYILVSLNKEVVYGIGIQKLTGYKLHFKKKDMKVFEDIIQHM